jgi:hypothetical protein
MEEECSRAVAAMGQPTLCSWFVLLIPETAAAVKAKALNY